MGDGQISGLPEGCISDILSLTSPRDCCRSAAVSPTFRSAADSDTVWDRFLPSGLSELLSRAVVTVHSHSKKDLYFRLCDGILIDGSRMIFSMERSTGRRCYTLSAREVNIVWGDTPDYWTWGPHQDSRFPEVAELVAVCWLEIRGKLDCRVLSQRTSYAAYLVFKLTEGSYNLDYINQVASVRVGSHISESEVCLQPHDEAAAHDGDDDDAADDVGDGEDEEEETRVADEDEDDDDDGEDELEETRVADEDEIEETRVADDVDDDGEAAVHDDDDNDGDGEDEVEETGVVDDDDDDDGEAAVDDDDDDDGDGEDEVEETRVVGRAPRRRHDGWMEMELGEFFNSDGDDGEVEMSLLEVKGGFWMGGLIVEGIEVRPR